MTWHGPRMAVTLALLCLLALGAAPAFAQQLTFSSNGVVNVLQGGNANPYPATMDVSGVAGTISDVNVTLNGVSLNTASTVDVLVAGPGGGAAPATLLSGDVPSNVSGVNWTFDDQAAEQQGTSAPTGTYMPTNSTYSGDSDAVSAPAPAEWDTTLGIFNGADPNGQWKLFVTDNEADPGVPPLASLGQISGWSIQISTITGVVSPSPSSKDFGGVVPGQTSASQTIVVNNSGNYAMFVGDPELSGANPGDFVVSNNTCTGSGGLLSEGQSCTMDVGFKPTAGGGRAASLVIPASNTPTVSPAAAGSVALTGRGLAPALTMSPASVDFGSRLIGAGGDAQTVTLTNSGDAAMVFAAPFALAGNDAGQFTLGDSTCVSGLAPGASCSFKVGFAPTADGPKGAAVVIQDNASGAPHSVSLAGIAIAPVPSPPGQTPPQPQESGSPNIDVKTVAFSSPPQVGQPTNLDVTAADPKKPVTGLIVDFGEKLGFYGESACVTGVTKGNETSFRIPYEFLTPGSHTIKITVFAGGCGKSEAHTYVFTVEVAAAIAARRVASAADTLTGPDITSKCKDALLAPTLKNGKKIVKALLCVMNEQRKLAKRKPLKLSKPLMRAALTHSRAMVKGGFFSHQGPKEPALVKRLKKVKYRKAAGENIGAGGGSLGSPVAMVNGWMHSSLHKANLLSRKWKTVGIGFLPQFPVPGGGAPSATYTADFGVK